MIGGARGIGAAIAERFAEEGARVTIADTLAAEGAATAARLGGAFVATDIARPADAEAAVAAALAAHGRLDILVQNAGIFPWTLIENTSAEEWDTVARQRRTPAGQPVPAEPKEISGVTSATASAARSRSS